MVYDKLLLSCGGGVYSSFHKASANPDMATIVIGVGGTGIDCLETVKTRVYQEVTPSKRIDGHPSYQNILFWGVDTFYSSQDTEDDECRYNGTISLTNKEKFNIASPQLFQLLQHPKWIEMHKELDWLKWDDLDTPFLGNSPPPRVRQLGRVLLMNKSSQFMQQFQEKLDQIFQNLGHSVRINIHIVSSLCGFVGAGCFLDICYMVKYVLKKANAHQPSIFGHFFSPDVTTTKIPQSDIRSIDYCNRVGYATLQDLDYCMRFPDNGDGFDQIYQGEEIVPWREPPVDYCNIVSARRQSNIQQSKIYEHAIESTAEYIKTLVFERPSAVLGNILHHYRTASYEKKHGVCHEYYSVDVASCYIPQREMNTWIVSLLFDKFSNTCEDKPSRKVAEDLIVSALSRESKGIDDVYQLLHSEICNHFDDSYYEYVDDWQFVRDYGDSQMVSSYTNQTSAKLSIAEMNAESMTTAGCPMSLVSRIDAQLRSLIQNISYGPSFVHGLVSADNIYNVYSIINGIICENNSRWIYEESRTFFVSEQFDNAKADFDNRRRRSIFDSDKKRFNDYKYWLVCLEQHKLKIRCFELLDSVLCNLQKQVKELVASYYHKLYRVYNGLSNTFKINIESLLSKKLGSSVLSSVFSIDEIKEKCNAEIEKLNIEAVFSTFMGEFLEREDCWLQENEDSIAELVNAFFEKIFYPTPSSFFSALSAIKNLQTEEQVGVMFANAYLRQIDQFLCPDEEEGNVIYNINPIVTNNVAFVSDSNLPLWNASNKINDIISKWQVRRTSQQNQITLVSFKFGIPICALKGMEQLSIRAYSQTSVGLHLYEKESIVGMQFSDWRELAPIIPLSRCDLNRAPYKMQEYLGRIKKLYEQASSQGVINGDGVVFECDEYSLQEYKHALRESEQFICRKGKVDIAEGRMLLEKLRNATAIKMVSTNVIIPHDGDCSDSTTQRQIVLDYFALSPVIQKKVENTCKCLLEYKYKAEKISYELESYLTSLCPFEDCSLFIDYCQALFSGVITWEGRKIAYKREDRGIVSEVVLSERNDNFPFNAIPIYQGYVSFSHLLMPAERKKIKEQSNNVLEDNPGKIAETCSVLRNLLNTVGPALLLSASAFNEKDVIICFIQSLIKKLEEACS